MYDISCAVFGPPQHVPLALFYTGSDAFSTVLSSWLYSWWFFFHHLFRRKTVASVRRLLAAATVQMLCGDRPGNWRLMEHEINSFFNLEIIQYPFSGSCIPPPSSGVGFCCDSLLTCVTLRVIGCFIYLDDEGLRSKLNLCYFQEYYQDCVVAERHEVILFCFS